jgi:hypothetical protein
MGLNTKKGRFWCIEPESLRPDEDFSNNIRMNLQFENPDVCVILLGHTSHQSTRFVLRSCLYVNIIPASKFV